ncbi:MAG: tetratricopeptide repeat protein [Candidatus Zixiibacteriota bacterium]|nr:MAG: tetratricopeptide repeat protein [candidate division Zixibacteria bacterium]
MLDRLDRCGGNGAYAGIPIIGHRGFRDKYGDNDSAVTAEVNEAIEMWRWKEDVARQRLPNHEPGSEQAIGEQAWINTCAKRAEELETGFSLILPTETYEDRKTLSLGDLTLNLIWFGRAKGEAVSIIVIPEQKLAILPDDLRSPLHLAPYPHPQFKELDVARWIQVLEEILEGENPVDNVLLCDFLNVVWPRDRAHLHLNYIRKLWNAVRKADAEGKSLDEVYTQLSLDNEFAFVKEMPVYLDRGDEWVRPQHRVHIRLFFLQGKTLASEIIRNSGLDSVSVTTERIRKLRAEGGDIYIEEASLNGIGYYLLNMERYADAIEVFRLNVETFPGSFNVYDSYAEALMKSGDVDKAIINYRKSLELNPENDNAREMLKVLEKS